MEKKELNMLYLLKRVINNAHHNSDVLTLTLLLHKILENNKDITINLELKTIDEILFNRLIDELDCTINEVDGNIPENFSEVSEGVVKLIKLHIERCKAEVKERKLYEHK